MVRSLNGVTYVFGADGKCTSNYKPGWEKTADGWKWKQLMEHMRQVPGF